LAFGSGEEDIGSVVAHNPSWEAVMNKTRIVVGSDGCPRSVAAVRWAAAEAQRRGVELRILTAYPRTPAAGADEPAAVVHDAAKHARAVAPDVEMSTHGIRGYAVPILLHAAEDAAMLVVGDRRAGRFPGIHAGSVCTQVATQARCCVAVVRGQSETETGPVVAGIGDDPEDAVLSRAFELAALRGTSVVAVTAGTDGRRPDTARLDVWRSKYPQVAAESEVVAGRPDKILIERSRGAQLVVVSPRRHGFEGVMLGSVGSHLLDRAECPVLIARG
jgi:nucleotide-binding universal stress UspA family protein